MKTQAAILVEPGKPLVLADLDIPALQAGQVLVEITLSGVCHTQLLEVSGKRGPDPWCPHCLGHEGVGVVSAVGDKISKVKVGDEVVLTWLKGEGADVAGAKYLWNGREVNAGGVTTFSRHAVVSENRLVPLPKIDNGISALLGCAVPTGFGAVFNVCGPARGRSLAVFGVGGIGACAVAAAVAAQCDPVIAVDVTPLKLDLARHLGAHRLIDASSGDPVKEILAAVPGGVDFAIEASGKPAVMAQALKAVRARGGAAVVIGNAPAGEMIALDPRELNLGKRLLGTWGGDTVPDRDIPRFASLITNGNGAMQRLVSRRYALRDINLALDELGRGEVGRPVIDMSLA
jgi:S-(hydroxymethyl)glutathione dehydrogenase / alcohol dehydrogenase